MKKINKPNPGKEDKEKEITEIMIAEDTEKTSVKKWYLVPILTEEESSDDFIRRVLDAGKLVLLFVIDQELMSEVPAGFIGSRIKSAETVIDKIKEKLPKTITVKDYVEWGSWLEKIENIARIEQADQIVMKKSRLSEEFAERLRKRYLTVELI